MAIVILSRLDVKRTYNNAHKDFTKPVIEWVTLQDTKWDSMAGMAGYSTECIIFVEDHNFKLLKSRSNILPTGVIKLIHASMTGRIMNDVLNREI